MSNVYKIYVEIPIYHILVQNIFLLDFGFLMDFPFDTIVCNLLLEYS